MESLYGIAIAMCRLSKINMCNLIMRYSGFNDGQTQIRVSFSYLVPERQQFYKNYLLDN